MHRFTFWPTFIGFMVGELLGLLLSTVLLGATSALPLYNVVLFAMVIIGFIRIRMDFAKLREELNKKTNKQRM